MHMDQAVIFCPYSAS